MKMDLSADIENINYLRYMEEQENKVKVNRKDAWSEEEPPQEESENKN